MNNEETKRENSVSNDLTGSPIQGLFDKPR